MPLSSSPTVDSTWRAGVHLAWPGRAGARHYRVWRTFLALAETCGQWASTGWEVRVGLRDLAETAVVGSKAGLAQSLEWLHEQGLVERLFAGTPDTKGERGERALYFVRYMGSKGKRHELDTEISLNQSILFGEEVEVGCSAHSLDKKKSADDTGPHLPDMPRVDMADAFVDEPLYLRLMDLRHAGVVDNFAVLDSPTRLGALLGVTRQAASEMVARWRERGIVTEFMRWATDVVEDMRTLAEMRSRRWSLRQRHRAEQKVRESALSGSWRRKTARAGRRFGQAAGRGIRPVAITADEWNSWVDAGGSPCGTYTFIEGLDYSGTKVA